MPTESKLQQVSQTYSNVQSMMCFLWQLIKCCYKYYGSIKWPENMTPTTATFWLYSNVMVFTVSNLHNQSKPLTTTQKQWKSNFLKNFTKVADLARIDWCTVAEEHQFWEGNET